MLDILLGNGEFIFEGKGSLGSLYSSSAPQYLGAAVGAGEAGSSVCVSFMERLFPAMGLSFAKFTSCSGSARTHGKWGRARWDLLAQGVITACSDLRRRLVWGFAGCCNA